MADIPAWLASVSPIGALVMLLVLIATAFMSGKIIPEKTHDRIVATKDEHLRIQQATTDKLLAQSDKQLENDENILRLLQSLPGGAEPQASPRREAS